MNQVAPSLRRYSSGIVDDWNQFWFTPVDPATLSAIRVCAGLMLLYTHLIWSLDLRAFFGPRGWVSVDVVNLMQQDGYAWSYFWWIGRMDSAALLWTIHIVALVVFFLLTVGYFSRTMSVLAYLMAVSYASRATGATFGLDKINCMLAMYLMIGPCGAEYSVDRRLANRRFAANSVPPRPSVGANVAVRMIQIHMCIVYLFSALGKLQGETWWDGTAVWMSVANLEYQSLDLTWLASWPKLVALLTHATVAFELFYCVLIWRPRWRPILLSVAISVHGGIAIALGMKTFGLVMLIGNMAFLSPRLVRAMIDPVWRGRVGEGGAGRGMKEPA